MFFVPSASIVSGRRRHFEAAVGDTAKSVDAELSCGFATTRQKTRCSRLTRTLHHTRRRGRAGLSTVSRNAVRAARLFEGWWRGVHYAGSWPLTWAAGQLLCSTGLEHRRATKRGRLNALQSEWRVVGWCLNEGKRRQPGPARTANEAVKVCRVFPARLRWPTRKQIPRKRSRLCLK